MHTKTVHDGIAKPHTKSRNGWNTKGYKSTAGQKLTGNYYNRATPVVVRFIAPRATA